jgi:hypothetical protein
MSKGWGDNMLGKFLLKMIAKVTEDGYDMEKKVLNLRAVTGWDSKKALEMFGKYGERITYFMAGGFPEDLSVYCIENNISSDEMIFICREKNIDVSQFLSYKSMVIDKENEEKLRTKKKTKKNQWIKKNVYIADFGESLRESFDNVEIEVNKINADCLVIFNNVVIPFHKGMSYDQFYNRYTRG